MIYERWDTCRSAGIPGRQVANTPLPGVRGSYQKDRGEERDLKPSKGDDNQGAVANAKDTVSRTGCGCSGSRAAVAIKMSDEEERERSWGQ